MGNAVELVVGMSAEVARLTKENEDYARTLDLEREMAEEREALCAAARARRGRCPVKEPTDTDYDMQRISFAFGNTKLSNEDVTYDMAIRAVLDRKNAEIEALRAEVERLTKEAEQRAGVNHLLKEVIGDIDEPSAPPGWTKIDVVECRRFPDVRVVVWKSNRAPTLRAVAFMSTTCVDTRDRITVYSGACKAFGPEPNRASIVAEAVATLIEHEVLEELGAKPHGAVSNE